MCLINWPLMQHSDATSPKTSEYAFFKKLKEDAGQRCHSSSIQRDAYLLKKPKSNDCSRGWLNDMCMRFDRFHLKLKIFVWCHELTIFANPWFPFSFDGLVHFFYQNWMIHHLILLAFATVENLDPFLS